MLDDSLDGGIECLPCESVGVAPCGGLDIVLDDTLPVLDASLDEGMDLLGVAPCGFTDGWVLVSNAMGEVPGGLIRASTVVDGWVT